MRELLPAAPLLATFLIASSILAVTPGPGVFYIVTRSLTEGRASGLASAAIPRPEPRARPWRIFRDGFLVALLNPKTALFFAAFLPQFVRADSSPMAQSALLGALFVVIAATTDTLYALAAGSLAPRLAAGSAFGRGGRYLAGGVFLGLGLFAAVTGPRAAK